MEQHHHSTEPRLHRRWLRKNVGTVATIAFGLTGCGLGVATNYDSISDWQRNLGYRWALSQAEGSHEEDEVVATEVARLLKETDVAYLEQYDAIVMATDTHCQLQANAILTAMAEAEDAAGAFNAGDTVNYGAPAEATRRYDDGKRSCVPNATVLGRSFAALGNHDTALVGRALRAKGWNAPLEASAIETYPWYDDTLLTINDPRVTERALRQKDRSVKLREIHEGATERICEEQPRTVLTHNAKLLDVDRLSECLTDSLTIISGHFHQQSIQTDGNILYLQLGNVSSASPDMQQHLGDHRYYVLYIDQNGNPVAIRSVTISTQNEITLKGPWNLNIRDDTQCAPTDEPARLAC